MFRKRLIWFSVLLTVVALGIMGRLVQIQVVQAAQYERLGERILTRRPEYIPAPRGSILDHRGQVLLTDLPTADICVHYGALTLRPSYLREAARALRKRGEYPPDTDLSEIVTDIRRQIDEMWWRLAGLTGVSQPELLQRAGQIVARVERWRAASQQEMIREENQPQPVLEDINNDVAVAVRLDLEHCPWLRVEPSSRRVAEQADSVAHLLGRLGLVTPENIAADPLRGNDLRELRTNDRCGQSGIERLAESSLRGARGRITLDYAWQPRERVEAVRGHDVHLTIDLDLQEYILGLLGETVQELPTGSQSGAAAVVVDVATREVRALVSYPTYSYMGFNDEYDQLQHDARRLPLLFRAVQAQYPPGSICKAVTLVGGLSDGVITPETRFHCTGHLLPDKPDRFRCWIYNQYDGLTHDIADDPAGQNGESAVRNSCNIYFFQVGQKLGPESLCEWFSRFGFGRPTGTGLSEEVDGIVPDDAWMRRVAGRSHQSADAWNFAIGQGEVTITPIQAANVTATIAAGSWAPLRLAYDDSGHAFGAPPAAPMTFDDSALRVLRRGMWRVVNEVGGTAHKWAALDRRDYELCGKTGSAQTPPRPVAYRYTFEWPGGHRESVVAYLEEDALAQAAPEGDETPRCVGRHAVERYPDLGEGERLPSHAWFIGYTQPTTTPRGERPSGKVYAIAVLVEFGGSGGSVAGPVARKIAEYLLR
jgi:penicillin-binding protein 2